MEKNEQIKQLNNYLLRLYYQVENFSIFYDNHKKRMNKYRKNLIMSKIINLHKKRTFFFNLKDAIINE